MNIRRIISLYSRRFSKTCRSTTSSWIVVIKKILLCWKITFPRLPACRYLSEAHIEGMTISGLAKTLSIYKINELNLKQINLFKKISFYDVPWILIDCNITIWP